MEAVCSKPSAKCKQHTARRKRDERWPVGYFHRLNDKDGPSSHGDASKGIISEDMMMQFERLRHLALNSAAGRLSGTFEGVASAYDDAPTSEAEDTDTDYTSDVRDDGNENPDRQGEEAASHDSFTTGRDDDGVNESEGYGGNDVGSVWEVECADEAPGGNDAGSATDDDYVVEASVVDVDAPNDDDDNAASVEVFDEGGLGLSYAGGVGTGSTPPQTVTFSSLVAASLAASPAIRTSGGLGRGLLL